MCKRDTETTVMPHVESWIKTIENMEVRYAISVAVTQHYAGSQYDILIVVEEEIRKLIRLCVKEMRVDED